ncbi:MAG: DNA polymerase IV [Eubacteriales bacterium]|nr:DNA polymerase IV [Eubacteriales bacterium]
MDRVILHIDANCFFASVETAYNPKLAGLPIAVCGDAEARHGIILTANYNAKRGFGVKTGEQIQHALAKCPNLVIIKSNPQRYLRHSELMRAILADYSNDIEPFGCDEAWMDISNLAKTTEDGAVVAREISERIKCELHITVSIGVSFCKVFAKFASDYKKPDAITVISRDNYKDIIWNSPCDSLIYVGRATKAKLAMRGIFTIGDIARAKPEHLKSWLGKNGLLLHSFATGCDISVVRKATVSPQVKSVGNSTTAVRDLVCDEDVKRVFFVLADSLARRLREKDLSGNVVTIWLRRNDLSSFTRRHTLQLPVDTAFDIAEAALRLFYDCYTLAEDKPLRSVGITVGNLVPHKELAQISLFPDEDISTRRRSLELAMDSVRAHYGYYSICRASLLADKDLTHFDPKSEHTLHPIGDFNAVRPA